MTRELDKRIRNALDRIERAYRGVAVEFAPTGEVEATVAHGTVEEYRYTIEVEGRRSGGTALAPVLAGQLRQEIRTRLGLREGQEEELFEELSDATGG